MRLPIALLAIACAFPYLAAASDAKITFHKNVEPILQARCQSCHRPGEAAPMSLLTYSEARPWAKAIKQAVLTRKMPPWFADETVGHFRNDRTLRQEEIDTLVKWADGGAIEGNPKDAPAPLEFTAGWAIGKPDIVLGMPAPLDIPAQGTLDYQWVLIPGFKEDKWIQAFEVRPGNRAVVHHVAAFWRRAGSPWMADAKPGVPIPKPSNAPETGSSDGIIAEYVPGIPPLSLPSGYAMKLPAGADIILQVHYTPNGTATKDQSSVGFVFAPAPPQYQVITYGLGALSLKIPPFDPNYSARASASLGIDVQVLGMNSHMHLRGKSTELTATYPDGRTEELLRIPKYDFNWQLTYEPVGELHLPAGTKLSAVSVFDNSPNNPFNPDPSKEVHFGDQTSDEMMAVFMHLAFPADVDPRMLYRRPSYPPKPAAE
ncbi:MAG TPA: thiol-disulfide isomerase [Bryobacteraceae bacterium]|nr:thiol-disulfide isomerase [Bryobacteraceae bacterium]